MVVGFSSLRSIGLLEGPHVPQLRQPKISRGRVSAGTSFATGLPFFVITMGSRVVRTSFMIFRHCALNLAAGVVFINIFPRPWGYLKDHLVKRNRAFA